MAMPPPGDPRKLNEKLKEPTPKSLKEVPGYVYRVVKSTLSRLFYIFKIVYKTRPWILIVMVLMAIFDGVMPTVSIMINAQLLNGLSAGITQRVMTPIYIALAWQFGYLVINSAVHTVYNILYRISGELVTNSVKVSIMKKTREVDLASYDKPEFYERLENANREAGMRPVQVLSGFFSIFSSMISFVSGIVVLAGLMPLAPIVMIAISVPSAVVSFIYRRKNFLYMRHRSLDRRQMSYYSDLLVNKDMVKEVRLFNLADHFIDEYRRVFDRYFGGIKRLFYAEGAWNIGFLLASTAVQCAIYIYIASNIVTTGAPIGDFSVYTGALGLITSSVSSMINTFTSIYEGTLFVENLVLFMNEKQSVLPLLPEKAESVSRHSGHTITFDHVWFRYPGVDRDILKDINFTLNAGDTCVLVGLNGAGKTTLIKLLTRLYDPTQGTIYLDGKDIRSYDTRQLYDMFGIIFQDFGKYAFSVRDNISFGDIERDVNEEEVRDAAEQSSADVFIKKLPHGYDTPLMRFFYDDGIELSIGQWQKLSVARAFYSDSDVLILDEPTASLDAIAEQEIFNQFDALRKDKTTIFVSHRLSSATVANKIIVLDGGEIAEIGDHRSLMEKHGTYYNLFSTQAKRYIDPEVAGEVLKREFNGHHLPPDGSGTRPPFPPERLGEKGPRPEHGKAGEQQAVNDSRKETADGDPD